MWDHYRKTFVLMQSAILVATGLLWYFRGPQWRELVIFFVFMQVASLFGARTAGKLKRNAEIERERLPLERR